MRAERMYRISKVLNHNTIIGIQEEDHQEYLIMGKGIGFGKKVTERVELPDEVSMYSLKETTGVAVPVSLPEVFHRNIWKWQTWCCRKLRESLGRLIKVYYFLWQIILNMR